MQLSYQNYFFQYQSKLKLKDHYLDIVKSKKLLNNAKINIKCIIL